MARRERYKLDKVAEALRASNGLRSHAARMLGCAPTTITNYINHHKILQEIMSDVLETHLDIAEGNLMKNIAEGKEQSLFFFLKCKGRERGYIEKQVIEGPGGGPVQQVVKLLTPKSIKDMSDEELEDFVRGECGSGPR
jgi:predicted transcriptional regulator